ncbi:hypothetical protein GCM10010302_11470 [Streptomyces polychromogenes]|uniref:Uncharacterized protein n=1 Tax=Streptomyces polychromogenes TaxID=67342 RepID=A0ABN0V4Z7_9ACTN
MTDRPAAAAAASAHIRELAEATSDPHDAYAGHADVAAVTASLHGLARDLEEVLEHLACHVGRHDDAWAVVDGERRLPGQLAREAGGQLLTARAQAHNMARALERSVETLGRLRPAP